MNLTQNQQKELSLVYIIQTAIQPHAGIKTEIEKSNGQTKKLTPSKLVASWLGCNDTLVK